MFLSKIWFLFVALVAAIALMIALILPRPAQRQVAASSSDRLTIACSVVDILLGDEAHTRVSLAGKFARAPEIVKPLEVASNADKLDEARMKQVRDAAETLLKGGSGRLPDFAMLIDRRGRVVARVRLDANDFGDVVAGRPLIDDALAGYLRDDIWAQNGTMYFVSAAPVVNRDPPVSYVGAVVLGHKVTAELAKTLVKDLDVDLSFSLGNDDVAGSKTLALEHAPMMTALKALTGSDVTHDCADKANHPFDLQAGPDTVRAIVSRLPGEAMSRGAFFTVYVKQPISKGLLSTLGDVKKSDLSLMSGVALGIAFLVALALGMALMWFESDRPLRRLSADAVKLAKNETDRLAEDAHAGKFGSIARSVNIHIDKLGRDAKSARANLDQLLGPAPEGSLGTIDLLAGALPGVRSGGSGAPVPPPASEFKFHDPAPLQAAVRPTPTPIPAPVPARPSPPPRPTPPPAAALPPVVPPAMATPARVSHTPAAGISSQPGKPASPSLDDDILGASAGMPPSTAVDPHFKQVFDEFLSVKKSCNESISGLTFQKFSEKLTKNRDDLMTKTGCKEVRFTVYVKDGKAALKATPVKSEA